MSLIGAGTTVAASEPAERPPLAGGISQDALEAICSEFGEDKSTLVELYQAARDENELLEFKNYELQFKMQEMEFGQKKNKSLQTTKRTTQQLGKQEETTENLTHQLAWCAAHKKQRAQEATSGTPTTNLQPRKPQVALAVGRVNAASAPKRSDNNGQQRQQQRQPGQPLAAAVAKSTSVNFEHENDDLNNAPNESGNEHRALSSIVGPSARQQQRRQSHEPVTSERANNENIESGPAAAAAEASLATAANETKNGISFARSTGAPSTINAAAVAAAGEQHQQQTAGQCHELASTNVGDGDANECGQSPEDAAPKAAGSDSCGSQIATNIAKRDDDAEMGARKTNIKSGQPQTNDAPECGEPLLLSLPVDHWPGQIEYNDQQVANTALRSLEQQSPEKSAESTTRSESVATVGRISLARADQVSSSSSSFGQTKQLSARCPSDKATGMARIAMPVQRVQVSGDGGAVAKSGTAAANRAARNRAHSITSGAGSRSSSATNCRQTVAAAAVNKSAAATGALRANPMRVRSKSSLGSTSAGQRQQQRLLGGDSTSSALSGAASISSHLPRRLGGSSLQLNQQQRMPQLTHSQRSLSTSRVCTNNSGSSSSHAKAKLGSSSSKRPSPEIRRSLTSRASNFVTSSVSQIPTLIDQSHATIAKLGRQSQHDGGASARLRVAVSQSSLLMGARDDERNQLTKSLSNLLRPIGTVAPAASRDAKTASQEVTAGEEQPRWVRLDKLSKSCVQMNEIDSIPKPSTPTTSVAKQLVLKNSELISTGEEINQMEFSRPVDNQGNRLLNSGAIDASANDESKRAACLQCKLFESKLDLLGRERALLSEQLSELEEMENDSRLASQKLSAQVGALEQQLDQCKFDLARSCESESKLRFQNKRLHFELRQRQECVQSLQQQLNELRSRARALFRLHRESKHQRELGHKLKDQDAGATATAAAAAVVRNTEDSQPSRRTSLVVDSCASSQTYDSAYSKSSSSSSGSSSSTNSEVDCCEAAEQQEQHTEETDELKVPTDEQSGEQQAAKVASASCTSSSSCDESEQNQDDEDEQRRRVGTNSDEQEREQPLVGNCLALANRQQVLKKRISIARILRGIQVQQPQHLDKLQREGQLSISGEQRARVDQAAAVNGCQTARIARVDHQQQQQQDELARAQAAQTNQSSESNQTTGGQLPSPPADGHRDRSPPVKQQTVSRKSPIELALEGVSELERSLAADEALQSLCTTSATVRRDKQAELAHTKAEGESSGECTSPSLAPLVDTTSATCQLIDGLKSEVSNLQMRLVQANTLNDNLILELKSQQRQQMNLIESGGQRKGQPVADDGAAAARKRSVSLVNATVGQQRNLPCKEQQQPGGGGGDVAHKRSSVIYVNGLNASVTTTHHHHHYEPTVPPARPHQPAVNFGGDTTRGNKQATYCHNCCHTNRQQFHATMAANGHDRFEQPQQQPVQQQQYRHSTGTIGQHHHHCEQELADFLKFLHEKLHFHHGRTFELVNECQKLAMSALLASYNQRVGLAHHQRVVLMGNQAAAAQQQQQQKRSFIGTTSEPLPPPRQRTRVMAIGQPQQQSQNPTDFVGQRTADIASRMARADQNNNSTSYSPTVAAHQVPATTTTTTTTSALQVAKQTLFSLVPIYYSSSCNNKQQQPGNNKEEATMKSSQVAGGLAREWTNNCAANNIQLAIGASDQTNSATAALVAAPQVINVGQQQQSYHQQARPQAQVQINGTTNDIYATVSRSPGHGARQANRVSILKISGRDDSVQQLAQGDNTRSQQQQQLDHHRSSCGAAGQQLDSLGSINQATPQQRPSQLLASVKDSLSEDIERFRVHANGQLLDLLTRQNWCESLVTEKLKTIEMRQSQQQQQQQPQGNRLTAHGSVSGGNGQANKSISLQLRATTNNDILGLNSSTSRNQDLTPVQGDANVHMLERSTLYCNGVKMTQLASSRPSSINVPTRTISQSVSLNGMPVRSQEQQQQQRQVYGISRPDCSMTNSLC